MDGTTHRGGEATRQSPDLAPSLPRAGATGVARRGGYFARTSVSTSVTFVRSAPRSLYWWSRAFTSSGA